MRMVELNEDTLPITPSVGDHPVLCALACLVVLEDFSRNNLETSN